MSEPCSRGGNRVLCGRFSAGFRRGDTPGAVAATSVRKAGYDATGARSAPSGPKRSDRRAGVRTAEAYLAALGRRGFSPRTLATYRYPLRQFHAFLSSRAVRRYVDVTGGDLAAWHRHLAARGLAETSLDVYLRAARNLMRWMTEQGWLFEDPAAAWRLPRTARRLPDVPAESEVARLLAQPSTATAEGLRDRAILEVAYGCALRRAELAGLRLRDLDESDRTLRVRGKGSRERLLPLGRAALEALRAYLGAPRAALRARGPAAAVEALWIGVGGRALGGRGLAGVLRRHSLAAGLQAPITPHGLRRACATHMLRRGAHPARIQALLGHATARHLPAYLRLSIMDIQHMHRASRPGR